MDRLIDYFAVVGYDFDGENKEDALRGKVLFRVPEDDWKDVPFTSGIELFCQPEGWCLAKEMQPPKFYVAILTDAEGNQQYCAVHSFFEPIHPSSPNSTLRAQRKLKTDSIISLRRAKSENDMIETQSVITESTGGEEFLDEDMYRVEVGDSDNLSESLHIEKSAFESKYSYAPKCLILLSRVHDFRILKNCLGLIYTVYVENLSQSIENIIAKLLLVKAPPPGSSMVRFSIGAADKQALQTPQSDQIPVTRASVTMLLRQLGILNVLNILSAALIDQKLLFYSCSYARLTEACNALTALMFPFKYSYPYIPILPKHLLECTSSPTPFLFGVHSSFKSDLLDLLDVVTVDLDGGVISVPECVSIPLIPDPYYTSVVEALTKVLCPDLVVADWAYPPEQIRSSEPERLDKEIRAIFLRLFSQLLMGYRSCLQVCRIHPHPIIRFQKEQYMIMRDIDCCNGSLSNQFFPKFLDSQAFALFIQDNGPPFRRLHLFDEVVAEIPDKIDSDLKNVYLALKHVKEIASDLYLNENPNHLPLTERIPKPSEGSFTRPTLRRFPLLSAQAVNMFLDECKSSTVRERQPRHTKQPKKRVPEGTRPNIFNSRLVGPSTSSRRLEVLRNCLSFIFESKTLEIKKIFQAVIRALKLRGVRYALVQQLYPYSKSRSMLDNQQFTYISRLLNAALKDSSGQLDEYRLAADILPIVTSFCRKLTSTVTQFMYTEVQDHPVWSASGFWECAFFDDIQEEIQHLYKDSLKSDNTLHSHRKLRESKSSPISLDHDVGSKRGNPLFKKEEARLRRDNQLCMNIASNQLKMWDEKTTEEQEELSSAEESVVFSQAMLNAQKMVYMLVPLDSSHINRAKYLRASTREDGSNSYVTSSWTGSTTGSMDGESGFDETQDGASDVASSVNKFISRFVDRVCSEASITNDHTKNLLERIPKLVRMQVESLLDVYKESSREAPATKPKLLHPQLLKGETIALEKPYRAFLVSDGRATVTGSDIGGPSLLPAEGALFITTYRVIFIGTPCDALASEQVVIRSFPVSSLFKMKTLTTSDIPRFSEVNKNLQHGIQLCSSTFQLLLLAFDPEVTVEEQERLQKELHDLRYPETIEGAFALSSSLYSTSADANTNTVIRSKSSAAWDNRTLTNARAMTLFKQAKRKAGFEKANKPLYSSTLVSGAGGQTGTISRSAHNELALPPQNIPDALDRSCEADYRRLQMTGTQPPKFRASSINQIFGICKSYPASSIVPVSISDDEIRALSHCHHNGRYPVVTWMHPSKNTLLVRSSAIRGRISNILFKHGQSRVNEDVNVSSSIEEKFLLLIASFTDAPVSSHSRANSVSNSSSFDDEVTSPTKMKLSLRVPTRGRKTTKKWTTMVKSNGKLQSDTNEKQNMSRSESVASSINSSAARKATNTPDTQLYVFVDRDQVKTMKPEQCEGKVTFVPLERSEPKDIRNSFKSFIKSILPVDPVPDASLASSQQSKELASYLNNIQESLWMEQVSLLLESSGCIVDVLDIHGASVMLAVDDGQDIVVQLSSLSELLMDPYYRTIDGFQMLVEKEWLSSGHRFGHRNRFNDIQSSGFTPIFLMFLDAVYQVHHQFPMSFEFNELFLEVIAYHFMSNRFNTFLLDSDYERLEAGILLMENEESNSSLPASETNSFWKYMQAAHKRNTLFYNPLYSPASHQTQVLRPVYSLPALKIWPYYVREALGEGPPFDCLLGELAAGTNHDEQEVTETSEAWGGDTGRRLVNRCYDNIAQVQPNSIMILLNRISSLQKELHRPVDQWSDVLNRTTQVIPVQTTKVSTTSDETRNDLLSLHKQYTVEFLKKQQLNNGKSVKRPRKSNKSSMSEDTDDSLSASGSDCMSDGGTVDGSRRSLDDDYGDVTTFRGNTDEVRTYEGALWKQGALIKGWKLKFFVLDTTKHELRQHDSESSIATKIIDLQDVESVKKIESISGSPKDACNEAFFELKTSKRPYNFIAESVESADKWIDHLEAALQ